MSDQTLRILLIDDRLGFQGTAKFFEWKLNRFFEESESQDEIKYQIEVIPERLISNLETRLKTEPFDLVLLDISFEKNEVKSEDSTEAHNNKEDLQRICEKCSDCKDNAEKLRKIGECALKKVIRPNFSALPVIVFTSKKGEELNSYAAKIALEQKALFDKEELIKGNDGKEQETKEEPNSGTGYETKKDYGFKQLADTILLLVKEYRSENSFKDKIEIGEDHRESEIEAKNRYYMQTKLWQILTEKIYINLLRQPQEEPTDYQSKFALAFLEIDGMKLLNEQHGYLRTNAIIKKFAGEVLTRAKQKDVILGRFSKERGDEFVICWNNLKTRKEAIKKVQELIANINDKKFQSAICSKKSASDINITASIGSFVYPDDLKWNEWKTYNSIKQKSKYEFSESIQDAQRFAKEVKDFAQNAYMQITEIPRKLKESAKALGKNQVCYYQAEEPLIRQLKDFKYSPYINVVLERDFIYKGQKSSEKDEEKETWILEKLFKFLFGNLAFDFLRNGDVKKENFYDDNYGRPVHIAVSVDNEELEIKAIKNGKVIFTYPPLCLNDYLLSFLPDESLTPPTPIKDIQRVNYYLNLLNSNSSETRRQALKSHDFMRNLYLSLFKILRKLARKHYHCEQYWPRYSLQRQMCDRLDELKEEVIFYKKDPEKKSEDNELARFFNGIQIPKPDNIWVSERLSNKEQKSDKRVYKHSLMLGLEISDSIAYEFLMLESGRNMVKFQNFSEGYFKGFLQMNPDGEFTTDLTNLIYWNNIERRDEENKKRIIVCRHALFSPVDPIVYNELVEVHRIRMDFCFTQNERALDNNPPDPVNHMSLSDAKKIKIIEEHSIVDKFVNKHFRAEGDINLVIYDGSEMIGPSVQVAEIAGCVTNELKAKCDKEFLLFDIFSGSSATALPSFQSLYCWVKNDTDKKAYLVRFDEKIPKEIDYLEKKFGSYNDKDNTKSRLKFKYDENFYLTASFDFGKGCIKVESKLKRPENDELLKCNKKDWLKCKISDSDPTKGFCGDEAKEKKNLKNDLLIYYEDFGYEKYINEFVLKKAKIGENENKEIIDLTIADPPHILAIPFLFRKGKDDNICFAKVISEKTRVFIVYYAHKEQVELCHYIRKKLYEDTDFKHVWRVIIAGEEMAVCCREEYGLENLIDVALTKAKKEIEDRYYGAMKVVAIEKLKPNSLPKKKAT